MKEKQITNIIDYMIWRGDLSFAADPFNEVDALILSRFSYMDMKDILFNDAVGPTIAQAYEIYHQNEAQRPKFAPQDPQLFQLMARSTRFKDCRLLYHDFRFDEDDVEQFSTITIELPDDRYFLSFRGTDNTVNGWKEDLLMTFDDSIPSQEDAVAYIHRVAGLTSGDLFLGGHSKGGNLAVYAALFCDDDIAKRIKGVFSFDGPGLHADKVKLIDDKIALPYIATYMPQSSIFGKMLSHKELQVTVHSNASGALQHDIYTWEVIRKDFVLVTEDTASSRVFDQAFHDYLAKLSTDDRRKVVNIIFDALEECDAETTDDLTENLAGNLLKVMKHMSELDSDDAKLVKDAINVLGDSIKEGIIEEISNAIPFFKKEKHSDNE